MIPSYEGDDFSKPTTAKPETQPVQALAEVPIEKAEQPDDIKADQDVDKLDEHLVDEQGGLQSASWENGNNQEFEDMAAEHDSHVMGIKEDG